MEKISVQRLNTLTKKVEYILEHFPHTRNSDIELQAELCARFFPAFERPIYSWMDFISVMRSVPSEDHIARARRKVIEKNNYRKYLPTDPAIAKARRISEEEWHKYAKQENIPEPAKEFTRGEMQKRYYPEVPSNYPPDVADKLRRTGKTGFDD